MSDQVVEPDVDVDPTVHSIAAYAAALSSGQRALNDAGFKADAAPDADVVEDAPEVEAEEAVADEAPARTESWDGWTAQHPAGLPAVTNLPKVNGVTADQLPDPEAYAKNGGTPESLNLVNRVD